MVDEEKDPVEEAKVKIYDDLIEPRMFELVALCKQHNISCEVAIEFNKGKVGCNVYLTADASWGMRLVEATMRCKGNIDQLIMACAQYARIHGHDSVFLQNMGIPRSGEPEETARAN